MRRSGRSFVLLLAAAILLGGLERDPVTAQTPPSPTPEAAPGGYAGMSLTEALLELRSRGLKIVFTSNVVRPELRVESEPTSSEPRQILEDLLAPHDLAVREGPGQTLVVVPALAARADEGSSIRGLVRSLRDGAPLPGARVRILESGAEVVSGAEGRFLLVDPGPGPFTLEAQAQGYLNERREGMTVAAGESVEVTLLLEPLPVIEEKLVVTPSRLSLLREQPTAAFGLSREEILRLPHLGDDFFRALTLLPGTAGTDVSAQFHVRGGRRDETQILIDGQELYEAFHLKDFDSALSFVAPATLGSADLTTGGFTAEYGDRMSGVLDMTTVRPSGPPQVRLGVGILSAHAGGGGSFQRGRGSWLAQARRGATDLVGRLLGDEDPEYWDAFGKLDYRLGRQNSLRLNLLHTVDKLDFAEVIENESKRLQTDYRSSYLWLTLQTILSSDLYFETAASSTDIDRDRRGVELEEDARFRIRDERDSEVLALRQRWHHEARPQHALAWGWELRRFDTGYDYFAAREFDNPLAVIRHDFGTDDTVFRDRFEEEHDSLYLADRRRLLEPLTAELGLRYDRHSQTDESHLSPRLNLAYALGGGAVMRLAWGRFLQSQRAYELQVEDRETTFHPVERSEHRVLGFEKVFGSSSRTPGLSLRVELYQRLVSNPRPRYENLYEPINIFPELEPDRVRIAPERSVAQGIELFLRGQLGQRVGWFVNYAYATTEDRIDGSWRPRIFDQRHSLNLDVDYRIGQHWRINLAWRFHSGWPTTPLSPREMENEEGEILFVPVLGPLNGDRLSAYHRLDLRASRRWELGFGSLDLFIDLQNVYDRKNLAGFDNEIDEELGAIVAREERWTGFLPSGGISFEF